MEGVLNVEAGDRPAQRVLLLFALLEGVLGSHEEVEVGVSTGGSSVRSVRAVDAIEGEDAVGLVCVGDIELVLDPLSTEDDLVLAAQHGHVVVEGEGVVVEMGDRVGAAADGEFVGGGQLQAVGLALIEIDAESSGVDVVGGISAVVAAPQDGDVRCVHDPVS